jgi:tetratricopeptide (TPR) repeat protein
MRFLPICILLTIVATGITGCATKDATQTSATTRPKTALAHLGNHHLRVSTESPEAQRAFDRGLTLAYSFAHFAAEQEFRRAAQADPQCAMAYWGIALVNGPHINFPLVLPDHAATAWEALTNAQQLARGASSLEQDLIAALGQRYANPQPEDRSELDKAYADAMRKVWETHRQSADAAALFAESLMDLHPWDLWTNSAPQPWTPEIVETLEQALKLDRHHPGANHLYIHAMEASPEPRRAVASADRLTSLVPDSSHMVHMPSHIYARVGRWADAAECNRRAMKADVRYRAVYPRPGFYAMYMAHNAHFLGFTAMMQGRREEAIRSARQMVQTVPEDFLNSFTGVADGYMAFVPEALMRFGMWEEIIKEPEPRKDLLLARALWRFTRAVALTALDRPAEAKAEQEAFNQAVAEVPKDRTMGNNTASNLLAIATAVLDGEMAAQAGDYNRAIDRLRAAGAVEDGLVYDEPPGWVQPTRHTLGAVLLKAGRAPEAEATYREELKRNPENGWSLMGLRDALRRQGKTSEAADADRRFKAAWARADVDPPSTCYCQRLN